MNFYLESIENDLNMVSLECDITLDRVQLNHDFFNNMNDFYAEAANDDEKNEKHQKNMIKRVIDTIKVFIQKLKESIRKTIDKMVKHSKEVYIKHKLDKLISNFDKLCKNAEAQGKKTFTFVDVLKLQTLLEDEMDEYKELVTKFSVQYLLRAKPQDAEKFLKNVAGIHERYEVRIENEVKKKKVYKISEAKFILNFVKDCAATGNRGFVKTLNDYYDVCDSVEKLATNTLDSLNKFSEDTGYIQNAKTLKDLLNNSTINLTKHTNRCIRLTVDAIVGIASISLASYGNTKNGAAGLAATVAGVAGGVAAGIDMRRMNDKMIEKRGNDYVDWKFTKGQSPLTFDKEDR